MKLIEPNFRNIKYFINNNNIYDSIKKILIFYSLKYKVFSFGFFKYFFSINILFFFFFFLLYFLLF